MSELEYKRQPFWVVSARSKEFLAGAKSETDAIIAAAKLNRVAQFAGTLERYSYMPHP